MKPVRTVEMVAQLAILAWLIITVRDGSTANTIPLFATGRILATYLMASLPLAFLCIGRLKVDPIKVARLQRIAFIFSCVSVWLWPSFSSLLAHERAEVATRNVVRSLVALSLVFPLAAGFLPWCNRQANNLTEPTRRQALLISIVGLCLIPALYVHVQVRSLRDTYAEFEGSSRVAAELRSIAKYHELVGDDRIGAQQVKARLVALKRRYQDLVITVRSKPVEGNRAAVLNRAMDLLSLDRVSDALHMLVSVEPDGDVLLLCAIASRELSRWADAEMYCQALVELNAKDWLAKEMLGEAFHQQRKYKEAIRAFEDLIKSDRQDRNAEAAVHMRISRVYMDMGERAAALSHCRTAQSLNPALVDHVLVQQKTLLQNSCMLR